MTYRGIRVITCPETGQSAAVELAAWRGAIRSVLGKPVLRIHTCPGVARAAALRSKLCAADRGSALRLYCVEHPGQVVSGSILRLLRHSTSANPCRAT
jgi:hypothetical protein